MSLRFSRLPPSDEEAYGNCKIKYREIRRRDKGKLFVVLATEGEYLLLADGKGRKVESPKRKKRRHVLFVAADDTRLSEKIRREEKISNIELRRTLAAYRGEAHPDQEG